MEKKISSPRERRKWKWFLVGNRVCYLQPPKWSRPRIDPQPWIISGWVSFRGPIGDHSRIGSFRGLYSSFTTCHFRSETKPTPYRSVVWKYVFLLHVLNEIENIINAGKWVLFENRKKLIPSKKNHSVLIAQLCSRKTQEVTNQQK